MNRIKVFKHVFLNILIAILYSSSNFLISKTRRSESVEMRFLVARGFHLLMVVAMSFVILNSTIVEVCWVVVYIGKQLTNNMSIFGHICGLN